MTKMPSFRRDALIAGLLFVPFLLHVMYHAIDYLTGWHAYAVFPQAIANIFDPVDFYTLVVTFLPLTFGTVHALLDGFAFAPAIWLGYRLYREYRVGERC